MKMEEAVQHYRDYISITKTEGTNSFYAFYLRKIELYFKDQDVEVIGKHHLIGFISYIKKQNPKIKHATINKYIVTLKTIVKYSTNRIIDFKKLNEQKPLIPILHESTLERIFTHLSSKSKDRYMIRNLLLFHLLLDTGLRINEVLHLKLNDIDTATSSIHVRFTKTNEDRYVFFTASTSLYLTAYLTKHHPIDYVFFDFDTGKRLVTSSIESLVHRLKTRLHIKESISPHKWRHTFATHFLHRGGNLETLRLILGHTNLKTTQKYLHLTKENVREEYQRIMVQSKE